MIICNELACAQRKLACKNCCFFHKDIKMQIVNYNKINKSNTLMSNCVSFEPTARSLMVAQRGRDLR